MKLLKIKDNSYIKKDDFFETNNLVGIVADKTLEQLQREGVFIFPESIKDTEDMTKDQMILKSINDSYHSENVMGFLGIGNERLVIESRFSTGGNDYLFQYLLERVLDYPNVTNLESNGYLIKIRGRFIRILLV